MLAVMVSKSIVLFIVLLKSHFDCPMGSAERMNVGRCNESVFYCTDSFYQICTVFSINYADSELGSVNDHSSSSMSSMIAVTQLPMKINMARKYTTPNTRTFLILSLLRDI